MFRMSQQRRPVVRGEHRPQFGQPVQPVIPCANCAAICAGYHAETRFLIGNRRLFDSCRGYELLSRQRGSEIVAVILLQECDSLLVAFKVAVQERKPLRTLGQGVEFVRQHVCREVVGRVRDKYVGLALEQHRQVHDTLPHREPVAAGLPIEPSGIS